MRAISEKLFIYENMTKSHPITIALSLFLIFASVFLWIARYWKKSEWNDLFSKLGYSCVVLVERRNFNFHTYFYCHKKSYKFSKVCVVSFYHCRRDLALG